MCSGSQKSMMGRGHEWNEMLFTLLSLVAYFRKVKD